MLLADKKSSKLANAGIPLGVRLITHRPSLITLLQSVSKVAAYRWLWEWRLTFFRLFRHVPQPLDTP